MNMKKMKRNEIAEVRLRVSFLMGCFMEMSSRLIELQAFLMDLDNGGEDIGTDDDILYGEHPYRLPPELIHQWNEEAAAAKAEAALNDGATPISPKETRTGRKNKKI